MSVEGSYNITNVADPINNQDAATKAYVDGYTITNPQSPSEDGYVAIANGGDLTYLSGEIDGYVLAWNGSLNTWEPQSVAAAGTPNLSQVLGKGNDAGNLNIINLADPIDPQDAATKAYVDGYTSPVSESEISPSLTGDVNNYSPTGWDTATIVLIDTDGYSYNITGAVAPTGSGSARKAVFNIDAAQNITLINNSGSSSAGNKFALLGDITILPGGSLELIYDSTNSVWRML